MTMRAAAGQVTVSKTVRRGSTPWVRAARHYVDHTVVGVALFALGWCLERCHSYHHQEKK